MFYIYYGVINNFLNSLPPIIHLPVLLFVSLSCRTCLGNLIHSQSSLSKKMMAGGSWFTEQRYLSQYLFVLSTQWLPLTGCVERNGGVEYKSMECANVIGLILSVLASECRNLWRPGLQRERRIKIKLGETQNEVVIKSLTVEKQACKLALTPIS